jgi:chromosome segregation ATPase
VKWRIYDIEEQITELEKQLEEHKQNAIQARAHYRGICKNCKNCVEADPELNQQEKELTQAEAQELRDLMDGFTPITSPITNSQS